MGHRWAHAILAQDVEKPTDSNTVETPASPRCTTAGLVASPHGSNVPVGAPTSPCSMPVGPALGVIASDDGIFINTSREVSLGSMQHDVIPEDIATFKEVVVWPLHKSALATPPRRRARRVHTTTMPRRSARLAKKVVQQSHVVAAVQNLLMRKLGLLKEVNVLPMT
jgi:hypothetical protein